MTARRVVRFAALAGALLGGAAYAQAVSIDIPAGSVIPNGTDQYKIVECGLDDPIVQEKFCSVEIYRDGELMGGGLRRYPASQLLKDWNSARDVKGLKPLTRDQASGRAPWPENAGAAPAPAQPEAAARPAPFPATQTVRTNPVPAAVAAAPGGACPRTPYVEVAGPTPPSTAMFKQVMESGHTFQRAAFLWTGVTFEAFAVGAAVRNKITMRPGVGPERVTDAAPVDAALYPVRASYVLCHQYASGPERTRITTGNYCFVSRTGKWACGRDDNVARTVTTPLG